MFWDILLLSCDNDILESSRVTWLIFYWSNSAVSSDPLTFSHWWCLRLEAQASLVWECLPQSSSRLEASSSERNRFLVYRDLYIVILFTTFHFNLELNPEKVKNEVRRLKNIQLERHKNIKFDREIFARKIVKYSFVIEKFIKLSAEDQKDFFCLHDAFQYLKSNDKSSVLDVETLGKELDCYWIKAALSSEVLLGRNCFDVPLTLSVAAKIIGIYNTNSLECGVCLNLARLNHSCLPSAELLTNTDLDTQDLRAVRTISKGITSLWRSR